MIEFIYLSVLKICACCNTWQKLLPKTKYVFYYMYILLPKTKYVLYYMYILCS